MVIALIFLMAVRPLQFLVPHSSHPQSQIRVFSTFLPSLLHPSSPLSLPYSSPIFSRRFAARTSHPSPKSPEFRRIRPSSLAETLAQRIGKSIRRPGAASKARVYADVNVVRPKEYWDYESLTVQWGFVSFRSRLWP